MLITSIPASELVEILAKDNYLGRRRGFEIYCFVLVREIVARDFLLGLFREHESLCSISGNRVLLVLFNTKAHELSDIRQLKKEIGKRNPESLSTVFFHHCEDVKAELLDRMEHIEKVRSLPTQDRVGFRHYRKFFGLAHHAAKDVNEREYLASMTHEVEDLKSALGISEADLPCLVLVDKNFDEVSTFSVDGNTDVITVYHLLKELIVRNIERRLKLWDVDSQIANCKSAISDKRRRHKKLDEQTRMLEELELKKAALPSPESIHEVISRFERRERLGRGLKKLARTAFNARDFVVELTKVLTGHH